MTAGECETNMVLFLSFAPISFKVSRYWVTRATSSLRRAEWIPSTTCRFVVPLQGCLT